MLRLTALGVVKEGGPHTLILFISSQFGPPLATALLLQFLSSGAPKPAPPLLSVRLAACKIKLCIGWCSAAKILSWFWVSPGFLFCTCNLSLKENHSNCCISCISLLSPENVTPIFYFPFFSSLLAFVCRSCQFSARKAYWKVLKNSYRNVL